MIIYNLSTILLLFLITTSHFLAPPDYPYQLQPGTPVTIQSFIEPEAGCSWTGIAGQVFDANREPVDNIKVELNGTFDGNTIQKWAITGTSEQMGAGGYEIKLADETADSQGTLYLQLYDQSGGELSDQISINTVDQCYENLLIANFIEFIPVIDLFFPIIRNTP